MTKDPIGIAKALIRTGLATNDEALVKQGEAILERYANQKPEEPKRDNSDFIAPVRTEAPQQTVVEEDGTVKKLARRESIDTANIHNEWTDDGEFSNDQASKIIAQNSRVGPRHRNTYAPVEVVCTDCSKTYKVNPAHVREFYRCDSCLRRRSRV